MGKKGLGKFVVGAGIGAALGLLFAPKKGSELRSSLKKKIDEFMSDVNKLTIEDVKKEFTCRVDSIKKELEELDKETVVKAAQKKSKELQKKAEELVNLAKEKGTPVLVGIADDLKTKVASVCREIADKLEK